MEISYEMKRKILLGSATMGFLINTIITVSYVILLKGSNIDILEDTILVHSNVQNQVSFCLHNSWLSLLLLLLIVLLHSLFIMEHFTLSRSGALAAS